MTVEDRDGTIRLACRDGRFRIGRSLGRFGLHASHYGNREDCHVEAGRDALADTTAEVADDLQFPPLGFDTEQVEHCDLGQPQRRNLERETHGSEQVEVEGLDLFGGTGDVTLHQCQRDAPDRGRDADAHDEHARFLQPAAVLRQNEMVGIDEFPAIERFPGCKRTDGAHALPLLLESLPEQAFGGKGQCIQDQIAERRIQPVLGEARRECLLKNPDGCRLGIQQELVAGDSGIGQQERDEHQAATDQHMRIGKRLEQLGAVACPQKDEGEDPRDGEQDGGKQNMHFEPL